MSQPAIKWYICIAYIYLNLVNTTFASPEKLYLGLFSGLHLNQTLTIFERDSYQDNCTIPFEDVQEECKYYGDCCTDPMRIREKLEPGTFSCRHLPSLGLFTF